MDFPEIEKTIVNFGKQAREGNLTIQDMSNGTFTISNGGVYGSMLSSPFLTHHNLEFLECIIFKKSSCYR